MVVIGKSSTSSLQAWLVLGVSSAPPQHPQRKTTELTPSTSQACREDLQGEVMDLLPSSGCPRTYSCRGIAAQIQGGQTNCIYRAVGGMLLLVHECGSNSSSNRISDLFAYMSRQRMILRAHHGCRMMPISAV